MRLINTENSIDDQIKELQTKIKYDTKEYPVETIVEKYLIGKDNDESEIFVPLYQRWFTWDKKRQSKFIESVLLDIPIPLLFLADVTDWDTFDFGRLEIVDWSQRIRTLSAFLSNELQLEWLKKVTYLNGAKYSDLSLLRQRRLKRTPIRRVELRDCDIDTRRDIFERINTWSDELNTMEVRKWSQSWRFYNFLKECSENPLFIRLCPISPKLKNREEDKEYILRFFAYSEEYSKYKGLVREFLDKFMKDNKDNKKEEERIQKFNETLEFVDQHFPYWFRKSHKDSVVRSRVWFEAIAVGTRLALNENPNLNPSNVDRLQDEAFKKYAGTDAANNLTNFRNRIEYVRDKLLS